MIVETAVGFFSVYAEILMIFRRPVCRHRGRNEITALRNPGRFDLAMAQLTLARGMGRPS